MSRILIGVDVCKDFLDACARPAGAKRRFGDTPEGIEQLVAWVQSLGRGASSLNRPAPTRRPRSAPCSPPACPPSSSTPARSATSPRAPDNSPRPTPSTPPSSPISARSSPPSWSRPHQEVLEFRDLCDRRGQLVRMLAAEKNHRHAAQGASPKVQKNIDKHVAFLERQIGRPRRTPGPPRRRLRDLQGQRRDPPIHRRRRPAGLASLWFTCPNSDRAAANPSPPSSAWPRSPTTAGPPAASATSAAVAARSASRCTRPPWPPSVTARP